MIILSLLQWRLLCYLSHVTLKVRNNVNLAVAQLFKCILYPAGTGDRNNQRPRTCPELQRRLTFLECDGEEFEEEQCEANRLCYCVDEVTGERVDMRRTYTRRDFETRDPCDGEV